MKKLDRLGWAAGIGMRAFGVQAGVRVSAAGILPKVLPLLPPGWKSSRKSTVQRLYSLVVAKAGQDDRLRRLHILYADGGRSLSGKTTLVRELLRRGATYYSDEFAVVDDFGNIHPFPRPLGIREDSTFAQTKYAAATLGATSGIKPLALG